MKFTDRLKLAVKSFNQPVLSNSTGTVLRNYSRGSEFNPHKQLQGITYKAIEKIALGLSLYEPIVVKRGGDAVINHPIYNLLRNPNPNQTWSDFIKLLSFQYEIYGECFIYKARGEQSNKVKEIYLLDPSMVELMFENGELVGYKLHKQNGKALPLELDEIIHDKATNPFNEWRGLSVMEKASTYINTEITTSTFTLNYMRNNASPSGIVTLPDMETETFKQFAQQWREGYEGAENAGKTAFIRGSNVEFKAVGATLKDVDQEITRKMSKEDVLLMFDVPKGLLGISDTKGLGVNEIEPLEYVFAKYNLEPRMNRLDQIIEKLAKDFPYFNETYEITHESPVPDDKKFRLEQQKAGVNVWLTVNEVREQQGLPPIPGGDEIKEPTPAIALSAKQAKTKVTLKKEAEPKDPEEFRSELISKAEVYTVKVKRAISKYTAGQEKKVIDNIDVSTKAFEEWLFELKEESIALADQVAPILYDLIEEQAEGTSNFITGESFRLTNEVKAVQYDRILRVAGVFNEATLRKLEETITEGVSKGESVVKLKKRVEATYKDAKGYRAERIARTESIRTSNFTAEEVYRQNGSTKVKWFANPGACEFCQSLDGTEKEIGNNFAVVGQTIEGVDDGQLQLSYDDILDPPLHPNCGCSILPVD